MGESAKQGLLQVRIGDKTALYNAYMGYLNHGGLFVPTTERYSLGDDVVLLVTLEEEGERLSVAGKVAWITPADAGNRTQGVGVHFNETGGDGEAARTKIEAILGGMLGSSRRTHTM